MTASDVAPSAGAGLRACVDNYYYDATAGHEERGFLGRTLPRDPSSDDGDAAQLHAAAAEALEGRSAAKAIALLWKSGAIGHYSAAAHFLLNEVDDARIVEYFGSAAENPFVLETCYVFAMIVAFREPVCVTIEDHIMRFLPYVYSPRLRDKYCATDAILAALADAIFVRYRCYQTENGFPVLIKDRKAAYLLTALVIDLIGLCLDDHFGRPPARDGGTREVPDCETWVESARGFNSDDDFDRSMLLSIYRRTTHSIATTCALAKPWRSAVKQKHPSQTRFCNVL